MSLADWCILAAALLPILTTGLAKGLGGSYDNHDPRGRALAYDGAAKRAHAAHQNGFEAFPFFAIAVIFAQMKGGPGGAIDALALAFVLLRIGYVGAYVADRATLRSVLWSLAFFAAIAIFVSPLWR